MRSGRRAERRYFYFAAHRLVLRACAGTALGIDLAIALTRARC